MTPPLPELMRWVTEMPSAFRAAPEPFPEGSTRVRAVVGDLFETLLSERPSPELLDAFDPTDTGAAEHNRLRWVLAASHLLWHPGLREAVSGAANVMRPKLERLFLQELAALASVVACGALDEDEERREELIRRATTALGVSLAGESPNEAAARLEQVDSVERRRVLLAAAARERRAREVREAMARKAAEEAAAKVSRE